MWNLILGRSRPSEPEAAQPRNPALSGESATGSGGSRSSFLQNVLESRENELLGITRLSHDNLEKLEGESMALQESNKELERMKRNLQEEKRLLNSQNLDQGPIGFVQATETLKNSLEERFTKNTDDLQHILQEMQELKRSYSLRGSDLLRDMRDDRGIVELEKEIESMLNSALEKVNECTKLLMEMKMLREKSRRSLWAPFYGFGFVPPPQSNSQPAFNANTHYQSVDKKLNDLTSDYARLKDLIETPFSDLVTTLGTFSSELESLKKTTEANGASIEDLKRKVEFLANRMNQDLRQVSVAEVGIQVDVFQELVVPPAPIASKSQYLRSLLDSSKGSVNQASMPAPAAPQISGDQQTRQVLVSEAGVQVEMEVERVQVQEPPILPSPASVASTSQSQLVQTTSPKTGKHDRSGSPAFEREWSPFPPPPHAITILGRKRLVAALKIGISKGDLTTWIQNGRTEETRAKRPKLATLLQFTH